MLTDDMTFPSFDNHFETKVLFLMYFGSQIINEYYDDTNNGRMAIDKQLNWTDLNSTVIMLITMMIKIR